MVSRHPPEKSVNGHVAHQRQFVQHLPRAHHDHRQRIVRQRDRQPRFFAEQNVEVAQYRATAGQHWKRLRAASPDLAFLPT